MGLELSTESHRLVTFERVIPNGPMKLFIQLTSGINQGKETNKSKMGFEVQVKIRIDEITYPKNWAPAGPISTSLLANPSPSTIGGGLASLCLFTKRQVMRVGAVHLRGGMMILIP